MPKQKTHKPLIPNFEWRKKPVVIEAVRWKEDWKDHLSLELPNVPIWAKEAYQNGWFRPNIKQNGRWQIKTLEGNMQLHPGDWLIRGVQGELYPCKHDIFVKTYEKVKPLYPDDATNPVDRRTGLPVAIPDEGMDYTGDWDTDMIA